MQLNTTERKILYALSCCRFLPGSYPKKLARDLNPDNVSPLQRYYLHFFCIRYRKQINNAAYLMYATDYISRNPKPLTRRESERVIKKALKTPKIKTQ